MRTDNGKVDLKKEASVVYGEGTNNGSHAVLVFDHPIGDAEADKRASE